MSDNSSAQSRVSQFSVLFMHKKLMTAWRTDYFNASSLFAPLAHFAPMLETYHDWPSLADYQRLFEHYADETKNANGVPLRFVPQLQSCTSFDTLYEPSIYLHGAIQTRARNWHDFFQVLVWSSFPRTKIALNTLHYHAAEQRKLSKQTLRTPLENALTLFDECGAIIVTSNEDYINLIRSFHWKSLFHHHRDAFKKNIACFIFGHALYEKALNPYIGMTANSLFLLVEDEFFTQSCKTQLRLLDDKLASVVCDATRFSRPADLHPFPLLGVPGWWPDNDQPEFYDDTRYFRPGRQRKSQAV